MVNLVRQLKITFSSGRMKGGKNAWRVGREAFPVCPEPSRAAGEGFEPCNSWMTELGCPRTLLQFEFGPTAYLQSSLHMSSCSNAGVSKFMFLRHTDLF